jgi:hypothetical protein
MARILSTILSNECLLHVNDADMFPSSVLRFTSSSCISGAEGSNARAMQSVLTDQLCDSRTPSFLHKNGSAGRSLGNVAITGNGTEYQLVL